MPKHDPPTLQSPTSFRDFARALRRNAEHFEELADAMEKEGVEELSVLCFTTGKDAFMKIRTYAKAIEDAFGRFLITRTVKEIAKTASVAEKKTSEALETLKKVRKTKD
jgi:hypothetical protein